MAIIDDFKKIEIRAGKVVNAERLPESEKLVKLVVSFGELGERQVLAGIAPHFPDVTFLIGKIYAFVTNLEPRMLMGFESQGMILATGEAGAFSLLSIEGGVVPGSLVR